MWAKYKFLASARHSINPRDVSNFNFLQNLEEATYRRHTQSRRGGPDWQHRTQTQSPSQNQRAAGSAVSQKSDPNTPGAYMISPHPLPHPSFSEDAKD